jgi:RNA polymerase sigma-70 factor, ECF subfamily
MSSPSVAELIAGFRDGREDAGDALLRRFEPWLRLLARGQVESRFRAKFDVSDLVQESMLEAVKGFDQFRGRSAEEFAGWLRQILARVLAHEIRRYAGTQKRDVARELSLDEELTRTSRRLGDLLAGSGSSPTQKLARHERELLLAQALERLPDDYRTVLTLRHLEGLSHEEVARRMGRKAGAGRMLWARALARLRVELGGMGFRERGVV